MILVYVHRKYDSFVFETGDVCHVSGFPVGLFIHPKTFGKTFYVSFLKRAFGRMHCAQFLPTLHSLIIFTWTSVFISFEVFLSKQVTILNYFPLFPQSSIAEVISVFFLFSHMVVHPYKIYLHIVSIYENTEMCVFFFFFHLFTSTKLLYFNNCCRSFHAS